MQEALIPTYFSHSYRHGDRDLNTCFLRYFWDNGFAFAVDPGSKPLSTTQLEVMMRFSAAFVAVVTLRDTPRYLCSPYIAYEYGLAVQADKPRLVIAERGVPAKYFPETAHTVYFNRSQLTAQADPGVHVDGLAAQVERLARESRPYRSIGDRPLGQVGVILPSTGRYAQAGQLVTEIIDAAGYTVEPVEVDGLTAADAALRFDRFDFVVHEAAPEAEWLTAFLQGRFIPAIRLAHHDADGRPAPVHPLLASPALRAATGGAEELVVGWSTLDDLEEALRRLPVPRLQFRSREEGEKYIASLGRAKDDAVFLSAAGEDHDLALEVSRTLDLKSIPLFHYQFRNTIGLGERWEQKLPGLVRGSRLFVPLVSRDYLRSRYCRQELTVARQAEREGRLTIIPYFLENLDDTSFEAQGVTLAASASTQDRAARIAADIDSFLISVAQQPRDKPAAPASGPGAGPGRVVPVDIAILTVLPEEYAAMRAQLGGLRSYTGTRGRPNRCDWVFGEIHNPDHGRAFRIVLGIVKKGTTGAALKALETARVFKPEHMILVGVAGAVDQRLRHGDVVVADQVHGYEYGSVSEQGYEPRPDWTLPTDDSLCTLSLNSALDQSDWVRLLGADPPVAGTPAPQVMVGAVASGNKVIDSLDHPAFAPVLDLWPNLLAVEMEAHGVAAALRELQQENKLVRFSMVRGISDKPVARRSAGTAARPRARQTRQRDSWKPYASATAAAYVRFLIESRWPQPPRR